MTTVVAHSYDWTQETGVAIDGQDSIHCWALDKDSKKNLIRIENYPHFCYVELPGKIGNKFTNWFKDKDSIEIVKRWICRALRDHAPVKISFKRKKKAYYYRGEKEYPMLLLQFDTKEAMKHCKNLLAKPKDIEQVGKVFFQVWEFEIDSIRKLLTMSDVKYCQWFSIQAQEVPLEDKISIDTVKEYIGDWNTMTAISPEESAGWLTSPGVLAFDIECYSPNPKAMPNRHLTLHVVYMISLIYQKAGQPNTRVRYGIVMGKCNPVSLDPTRPGPYERDANKNETNVQLGPEPIPGQREINIIQVKNEQELILKVAELVNFLDPEILTGYNIFGFDIPYINWRCVKNGSKWPSMSCIYGRETKMKDMQWSSSAYSNNSINYLLMDGRITVDMQPVIQRDYKYDTYTLENVSKQLLGKHRGKHSITAQQMFKIYENHKRYVNPNYKLKQDKYNSIKDILPSYVTDVLKLYNFNKYEESIEEMTDVMKYCIEDSELVMDLVDKCSLWISLVELSNIVGVTPMMIYTRGQQVRGLSQFYDLASRKGYVIDKREGMSVKYEGGFVWEPVPGIYENIICLDFASLYPSIIRAYNICLTTLIPEEHYKEMDSKLCNKFKFVQEEEDPDTDDEHDELIDSPKKSKRKKANIKTHSQKRKFKFVKDTVRKGIVPDIVAKLVMERRRVRDNLDGKIDENGTVLIEKERDPIMRVILDKRQLALKVTANSFFGLLGVHEGGKLPLIEAAMCITAKGRELIKQVNEYVITKYNGKIVYGDSVSGDTPILIKYNDKVKYIRIQDLGHFTNREDEKEQCLLQDVEVWSDLGWTPIKRVIRHKTQKKMYRVLTHCGCVDVTEDHSLLRLDGSEISPKDIKVGQELMHNPLPTTESKINVEQYTTTDKLLAAKMYHQMGGSISMENNEYIIHKSSLQDKRYCIREIIELPVTDNYVYDLETDNHHFSAGIGEMVVHNTDSTMIDLCIDDPKEAYRRGLELAVEVSKLFPDPLKMEFEKAMRIICFKKKKYAAALIGKNGIHNLDPNKLLTRGIILSRRDNPPWAREVYREILIRILSRCPMIETLDRIVEHVDFLLSEQIPLDKLKVIKKLGDNYASDTYPMKIFADFLKSEGKFVTPGDRLDYVIVKSPNKKEKVGPRMRSVEIYYDRLKSNKAEQIDYLYYLEKGLQNPIDQLFQVGFIKELAILEQAGAGYKPKRKDFRPIRNPVKMMVCLLEDGKSINVARQEIRKIVPKKYHIKMKEYNQDDDQNDKSNDIDLNTNTYSDLSR